MGYSRYREQSSLRSYDYTYSVANVSCTSGIQNYGAYPSGLVQGNYRSMYDGVNPDYQRRSRAGEIILSPMLSRSEERTISAGAFVRRSIVDACSPPQGKFYTQTLTGPWALTWIKGRLTPKALLSDVDISRVDALASTELWANLNSGKNADLMQDIAEFNKTVQMCKDPLLQGHAWIDNITRRLGKRGYLLGKGVKNVLNAPNLWLEYRYGVRPLISSLNGTLQAFIAPRGGRTRVTVRGKSSYTMKSDNYITSGDAGTTFSYHIISSDTFEVRCGALRADATSVAQDLGFNPSQILALPWQLVPYSFVADWFGNFEQFLQAVPSAFATDTNGMWTSSKRTLTTDISVVNSLGLGSYVVETPATDHAYTQLITKQRTLDVTRPGLSFRPGSIEKMLHPGNQHIIDSAAMLLQKMNRIFIR